MAASSAEATDLHDTVGPDFDDSAGEHWTPDTILSAGAEMARQAGWDEQAVELEEMAAVPEHERDEEWDQQYQQMMRTVQMIGGAVIGIAVVTLVVNEVLTTSSINNSTGPFSSVIDSLETTGVAAMSLLVIGLLVAAASKLMSFFGGGF